MQPTKVIFLKNHHENNNKTQKWVKSRERKHNDKMQMHFSFLQMDTENTVTRNKICNQV